MLSFLLISLRHVSSFLHSYFASSFRSFLPFFHIFTIRLIRRFSPASIRYCLRHHFRHFISRHAFRRRFVSSRPRPPDFAAHARSRAATRNIYAAYSAALRGASAVAIRDAAEYASACAANRCRVQCRESGAAPCRAVAIRLMVLPPCRSLLRRRRRSRHYAADDDECDSRCIVPASMMRVITPMRDARAS